MEDSRSFSGDEKTASHELTLDQRIQLEAFFERCPHPDETQGDQIAKEIGLEPRQMKHWFQINRKKMSQPESQAPTLVETSLVNQECNNCDPGQDFASSYSEMEVKRIAKVADLAMEELLKLMSINRPLWTKSSYGVGYVLVRERYANMFPRVDSLNSPHTHEESSKYYKVLRIGARKVVDMLLDSEEWVNLFPTIVSKSETIKVLDVGSLDNRNGALHVVYEEIHALSPLVSSRKLFFLRYCKQLRDGVWAISHVSIDSFEGRILDFPVQRLPSGCIIYQMTEDFSMVIWVEHTKVNDGMEGSSQRNLIRNNIAYGAESWLWALNRMFERFFWTSTNNMPPQACQKVVNAFNARKRATRLSNQMIKGFFGVLYKLRNGGFGQSFVENNNEIKISLRKNTTPGMPEGIIATAITTIRLPVPLQNVCSFLTEARHRSKWDVLACGFPLIEISHFTMEGNRISILKTYNRIESNVVIFQDSYIDPLGSYVVYAPISVKNAHMITNGGDSLVSILPSGFLITEDSPTIVESSNRPPCANNMPGSSLLTMAYQLLICSNDASIQDLNREIVVRMVVSTIQKIKSSLIISED